MKNSYAILIAINVHVSYAIAEPRMSRIID